MAILYTKDERVVTITINRPEAMNAIDPETHQELCDAWIRFRDDADMIARCISFTIDATSTLVVSAVAFVVLFQITPIVTIF